MIFTNYLQLKFKQKNKRISNDQSELAVDTRTGDKIGHVVNW